MRAAEGAGGSFFVGLSFLVSDDHDFLIADLGKACHDGSVVTEVSISMEFHELVEGE